MPRVAGIKEYAKEPARHRYLSCLARGVGVIVRHPFGASAIGTNAKATVEPFGGSEGKLDDKKLAERVDRWLPSNLREQAETHGN